MLKKIIFIILPILVLGFGILNTHFFDKEKIVSLSNNQKTQEIPSDFSILVLGKVGTGNGGKWHSAPVLADAIFVVNLENENSEIDIISLPRDLFGDFGGETFKINEVLRKNKTTELLQKLPEITGLQTEKYAVVDLAIVKELVDILGGVDVELKTNVIDGVSGFVMKAGQHHLTGDDVVWIIRNRFAAEGDFFREKNQHLILAAAMKKYQDFSTSQKLSFLIQSASKLKSIETNLSASDIMAFANTKNMNLKSIVLDFKSGLVQSATTTLGKDTAYILLPTEGINNYEKIKNYILEKIYE